MILKRKRNSGDRFFISDKFGIGDTRIYADYPLAKGKYIHMRLGFLTTLSTLSLLKKGFVELILDNLNTPAEPRFSPSI